MKQFDIPKWDFPAILRLMAVLGSLGLYLSVTQWTDHLELAFILILIACLIGSFVGKSQFSDLENAGISFVLGTALILLIVSSIIPTHFTFLDRLFGSVFNITQSFSELLHNQAVSNSMLFLTSILIICWNLGFFGGVGLTRRNQPWIPVALAGIGIVIIDLYVPLSRRNGIFTALFFFFLLFLITRVFFTQEKKNWKRQDIRFESEAKFDFNRLVIISSFVILFLAWTIPSAIKAMTPGTVEQLKFHTYMENLTERWNNLFAPLDQGDNQAIYSFNNILTIGQGIPTSEKTIFTVQADVAAPSGTHYYWRARSYDSYDGSNWFNSAGEQSSYSAGSDLTSIPLKGNPQLVQFSFRSNANLGIFFQGGIPKSINQSGKEIFNSTDNIDRDVIAVIPNRSIAQGIQYKTFGWVTAPTIFEMQNSSSSYPSWVVEEYLNLPPTVPDRVRTLAQTITQGMIDPFSKAQAITMYLRLNMHYKGGISSLPEGRDLVDWFLFDTQQGFCSHYASAEVVMLRAIGIPARLIVGYAQGAESQGGRAFTVRLKDSHAWPEVYFTDIGWVVFEPTVIIPQQLFPAGFVATPEFTPTRLPTQLIPLISKPDISTPNVPVSVEVSGSSQQSSPTLFLWILLGFGFLVIVGGGYLYFRKLQKKGVSNLPDFLIQLMSRLGIKPPHWIKEWERGLKMSVVEKQFRIIHKGLQWMNIPIRSSDTPAEEVARLVKKIPQIKTASKTLLDSYELAIFGGKEFNSQETYSAVSKIKKILIRERIKYLFQRILTS